MKFNTYKSYLSRESPKYIFIPIAYLSSANIYKNRSYFESSVNLSNNYTPEYTGLKYYFRGAQSRSLNFSTSRI